MVGALSGIDKNTQQQVYTSGFQIYGKKVKLKYIRKTQFKNGEKVIKI